MTDTITRPTNLTSLVSTGLPTSVFQDLEAKIWKYAYEIDLVVEVLVGGTPSNKNIVEGWIKSRIGTKDLADHDLALLVEEAVKERNGTDTLTAQLDATEISAAVSEVASKVNLNGFHRRDGFLVFPGRNVKAMLKEAISVAIAAGNIGRDRSWGKTSKGILSWAGEHLFIPEQLIPICDMDGNVLTAPTGIQQRTVSVHTGTSIAREEYVELAKLSFTVMTDDDQIDAVWPTMLVTAEKQGLGATRSQQYGRFVTTGFRKIERDKA